MPSFVISKLTRCRLFAVLSGLILIFAAAWLGILIAAATEKLIPTMAPSGLIALRLGILWIFATLLVSGVAAILGPYDLLAVVTCAVPALLYFGGNYAVNVFMYLPDDGGFYDILGGSPPIYWRGHFYFGDHLWVLSYSLAWGLATAGAGITLKRTLFRPKAEAARAILSPVETRNIRRGLIFDVGFLFLVIVAVLWVDQVNRMTMRPDVSEWPQSRSEIIGI